MGNPKVFLENYQKNKKDYLENKDVVGLQEHQKYLIAELDLSKRMRTYTSMAINKHGIGKVLDAFADEFAKNDESLNNDIRGSLQMRVDSLDSGELKDTLSSIMEAHKGDLNVNSLLQDLKPALFDYGTDKDKESLTRQFTNNFLVKMANPSSGILLFDQLIDKLPLEEDLILEESQYISVFEKDFTHPIHDKVTELIAEENKKASPDKDLIKALESSDKMIAGLTKGDDFASNMAESQGKMSYKVFDQSYLAYQAKHGGTYSSADMRSSLNKAEDFYGYWQKNMFSEYTPSKKFVDTTIAMIEYGRKNGVLRTDPATMNGPAFLSTTILQQSFDLEKAVNENNVPEIKRLSAFMDERTKQLDHIINNLKGIDDKHLFNSNMACSRETYYPAKYRLDYEGATLFNQISYISDISIKYNVKLEDMFKDPLAVTRMAYKEALSTDGPTAKLFHVDDPFSILEDDTGITDIFFKAGKTANEFVQFGACMSINNPENREACYNKVTVGNEILRTAFDARMAVKDAFEDLGNHPEVIAAMLVAGDKFNPFTMVNAEDGLVDFDSMQPLPPFKLEEYIESQNITNEDLLHSVEHGVELLAAHKDSQYISWFKNGVNSLGDFVTNRVTERLGCEKSVVSDVVKDLTGEAPLTKNQKATAYAKLKFTMLNPKNVEKKNIAESIKQMASFKKEYDSHNFLAKIFFPTLHQQRRLLAQMKQSVLSTNYVKEQELKEAIEELNQKDSKAPKPKFEALSNSLDEKTLSEVNKIASPIDESILEDADEINDDFELEEELSVSRASENEHQVGQ